VISAAVSVALGTLGALGALVAKAAKAAMVVTQALACF
jgi:hypothetical protein